MRVLIMLFIFGLNEIESYAHSLRAGVSKIDISPTSFPVIANGGFIQAVKHKTDDPLHSKTLLLSDGNETVAFVVVDSCMVPTDLCDEIKELAFQRTGIAKNRIMISATHTHSAPSVMSFCLGTSRDENYTKYFKEKIVRGIENAHKKWVPVSVGWGVRKVPELTNCRRWITLRNKMLTDPFGQKTVRAMMHPGYLNSNYVSPSGPKDPELYVFSIKEKSTRKNLCILANYSMHYFSGNSGFSSGYFGQTSEILAESDSASKDFLGIVSQGASGDLYWVDYGLPQVTMTRDEYSQKMANYIEDIVKTIHHKDDLSLKMVEKRIALDRKQPTKERLEWAGKLNLERGDRRPGNRPEVYAQSADWLKENPTAEVVLQTFSVGSLAITMMPNEVYAITGLKIKKQSPFEYTFNIELANGAEGYIPPPEQHMLGGYTTWPTRTAGLNEESEPIIVEHIVSMLEHMAENGRKSIEPNPSAKRRTQMNNKPLAYWPMDDLSISKTQDLTNRFSTEYQGAVALHLRGEPSFGKDNKSVYFAGGYCEVDLDKPLSEWTWSTYLWYAGAPIPQGSEDIVVSFQSKNKTIKLSLIPNDEFQSAVKLEVGGMSAISNHVITPRKWHQLSLSKADNVIQVSLNNEESGRLELPNSVMKIYSIEFGRFDGKLDEVILFN